MTAAGRSKAGHSRAVLFSHSALLGGAECCLVETAEALISLGLDVVVALPREGPLQEALAGVGAETRVVPFRLWLSGSRSPAWKRAARLALAVPAAVRAAALVRAVKPAFVYSNTIASPVGAVAAWLCRTGHVWHLHEFVGGNGDGPYFDAGERMALGLMRRIGGRVVANSQVLAEHYSTLLRLPDIPFVYQPVTVASVPPATLEPFVPPQAASGQEFRCVVVGSIEDNKNQEEAIRAIALLDEPSPRVTLTLAGPARPDYLARLERLIDRLGVAERVHLVPRYVTSADVLETADAVLVCSRRESFGRVTVEAMKAGLAVVGARSGGTAELIRDRETGLLYRLGDAGDLAAKIDLLTADRALRRRLGANAKAWSTTLFQEQAYAAGLLAALTTESAGSRRSRTASAPGGRAWPQRRLSR